MLVLALVVAPSVYAQGPQLPGGGASTTAEQPLRAPLTLTPSVSVAEEWNDNVFLNNARRRWDLVTAITPALTFVAEQPTYRLDASYDFTARMFARDPGLNDAFDRQDLIANGLYRFSPELTVTLAEVFSFNTGINVADPQGVATGRDRSWRNSIGPGVTWTIDPLTSVRASGSWSIQRYRRSGLLDSDIYNITTLVTRRLTPRLSLLGGYDFGYFDIQNVPATTTHTPRIGASYEFTPTLTATVTGGPTFEVQSGGHSRVTPAVSATIDQRFQFGSIGASYERVVATAGPVGGTTDNQTVRGHVSVVTLTKGLTVELVPQYRTFKSQDNTIDIHSFSIPLEATYQITAWFGLTAGYVFFQQRSSSAPVLGGGLVNDVDQNRVFFGLLVGYPIKFD